MESTIIHVTKKLEKTIKSLIVAEPEPCTSKLGKWNATLFHMDRKKCWLVTNALTKYNIVLTDIKAAHLKNISYILRDALYAQLIYDGVICNFNTLSDYIGTIQFSATNNDRTITTFQNHRLQELDWWHYEYNGLNNMPIKELTNRINTSPVLLVKNSIKSGFTSSIKEMAELL